MDAEVFTAIGAALAGVSVFAVIKVIRMFLRHIESTEKRQEIFLGNHLSGTTRAMEASARSQEKVADRLERVEDALRQPRVKVRNSDEVEVGP